VLGVVGVNEKAQLPEIPKEIIESFRKLLPRFHQLNAIAGLHAQSLQVLAGVEEL